MTLSNKKNISQKQKLHLFYGAKLITQEGDSDDDFVLNDEQLEQVINNERQLNTRERRLLLNSPVTLKHFRQLFLKKRADKRKQLNWSGSSVLLRAAAGSDEQFSIDSDDGLFSLHFIPEKAQQINMILSCDSGFADKLHKTQTILQVKDKQGNVLLKGRLDDENELSAPWPLEQSPREHFLQLGSAIMVDIA